MLFFGNPIRSRVMAVLNSRIADAESEYQTRCSIIDEETDKQLKIVEERRTSRKEAQAVELVNDLVGRFI